MFSIKINGFKTKEEAKVFLDWYEGQGEQDIDIWLDCNEINHSMHINVHKPYVYQDNTWIAELE